PAFSRLALNLYFLSPSPDLPPPPLYTLSLHDALPISGIAESSARKYVVRLSSTIDYVIESDIVTRNVVKMPRTIGKAAAVRPPSFQPQANFLVLLNCSKTAARSTRCIFAIKVGGKKGCTAGSKPPIADKRRQAVGTGSRIPEVY